MRGRVGDQERQACADAEESFLFGDHDRVLEFDGRDLLAAGLGAVGNSQLRQGAAAAGDGDGAWGESGALSEDSRWVRVQGQLTTEDTEGHRGKTRTISSVRLCVRVGDGFLLLRLALNKAVKR